MAEEIKRMNFFNGLFLAEEEFQLEQDYHLQMRRMHNSFFHGTGVVSGLEVKPPSSSTDRRVIVTPGAAIDSFKNADGDNLGREIIMKDDKAFVDLSSIGETTVYISIYYEEEETDVVEDKGGGGKIHLWERAVIEASENQPLPGSHKIILGIVNLPEAGTPILAEHISDERSFAGFDGMSVKTETLNVEGQTTLKSTLVDGSVTINNNLGVAGYVAVKGSIDIDGDAGIKGNLGVDGSATINNNLGVDGSVAVKGNVGVNGNAGIKSNLGVEGNATINNDLAVDGNAAIKGDIGIDGNARTRRNLGVEGNATIKNNLAVGGAAKVGGNLTVDGDLVVNGDTTSVNAATLEVEDNIITANRFKPKTKLNPNKLSGIEVFRGGSGKNAQLVFDENDDEWKLGIKGKLTSIATTEHLPSGVSRDIVQRGHGMKVGQAIRYDVATKKYVPAIADNEVTTGMFLVSTIIDNDNFSLVQAGFIEGLSGLKPGEYYYVSDKVAGELTNIEPLRISNPIFFAETDRSGYVLPFRPSETAKMLSSQLWAGDGSGNIHYDNGNVGIGVAAPKEKLEVVGNFSYSGTQNKLAVADHFIADVACADFRIGHSSRRGSLGRALVDNKDTLVVNFGSDWKNTHIGGNVVIGEALHVAGELRITNRIIQDDWVTPSLQNGWVRYNTTYNPPGYFRDKNGIIHLRGMVKSGTIGRVVFNLPTGYRPEYRELQPVQTNSNTIGRCDIETNGNVLATAGDNRWYSLDGISFRANGY